jgi:hypothetical protein
MVALASNTEHYDTTPADREYTKNDMIEWFPVARSELHGLANTLERNDAEHIAEQIRLVLHLAEQEHRRLKRCTTSTR